MNITYKQINETLYKVFLDEEEFCLVSKFDNEWEAWNEMASRTGTTKEDAVKQLIELLV